MAAYEAIRALLFQDSAVTTLVGDRIYPVQLPQDCAMPAVVHEEITGVELPTLDATSDYALNQDRIQVTVFAATYTQAKTLREACVAACRFKRGLIAGLQVAHIVRGPIGPDLRDDDRRVSYQSVDFVVTYQNP